MTLSTLEQNARRAKEAMSFSDYRAGSATSEYQEYCKEAEELAQKAKARLSKAKAPAERAERVDYLLSLYKSKKLEWLNSLYANRARVPSIMIAGGSNFPVRAKQKQNAREDALFRQNPDYILEEIRGIGQNAGTIYSDEANAVERIKAKIESLKGAPDPYGNRSAEVRRLKERLLKLAPEEFKEQQANISINGAKTYDEIVALWGGGRHYKSDYNPEDPRWYFDLPLVFTDGKRKYREFLNIEVDESGQHRATFNLEKRETELIPLTDKHKYNLIIGQISGSGNKAVIYHHLQGLAPKPEAKPDDAPDTATINGETAQVIRNQEDMRLQLIFDGKPDAATRDALKSNGFRWAPSKSAWQRLLNDNAERALKRMCDK
jgi:hypothetical protein